MWAIPAGVADRMQHQHLDNDADVFGSANGLLLAYFGVLHDDTLAQVLYTMRAQAGASVLQVSPVTRGQSRQ